MTTAPAAATSAPSTPPRRDPDAALRFYQRACDFDDVIACENLGYLYQIGRLTPRDLNRALASYQRGCRLNHPASCARVALFMRAGQSLPKDASTAHTMLQDACGHGVTFACEAL